MADIVQEDQVTLADKNVETSQFDRYKGSKGRTDRLALLSTVLIRGWRCYEPKKKKSFRAPTNKDILALVTKQIGPPEQRFGLVLFQYLTDESGNLIDATKCSGKVKVWAISEARYEELSNMHKSWPLLDSGFEAPQHDLMAACTEDQYQRFTFSPLPESHWKKKEGWYKALKLKEQAAQPKVKMALGKILSDTEIMEVLGATMPSQTGGTDKAGDVDLSDIIDDV
jgi:hypothetical protein